jgi:hypothetical protein
MHMHIISYSMHTVQYSTVPDGVEYQFVCDCIFMARECTEPVHRLPTRVNARAIDQGEAALATSLGDDADAVGSIGQKDGADFRVGLGPE